MLKQIIALAAVAIVATHSQAQNTLQAHQFRLDSCEVVAKRAGNAWKYREANDTYPMHTLSDTPMRVLHEWAVGFAMRDAGSAKEAIETSFAKCMDNIDRVYRDARSGSKTSMADLR